MRVTLVQPPSNRLDTAELAPPLGVMTVATVLAHDDVDVSIIDLNMECLRSPENGGPHFYEWASARIAETAPDLVGFTSMALESHIGLEIARRLKRLDPGVRIVMGGPHFSAIAEDVLTCYPWVDFVVVGEGETAARGLVRALRRETPLASVPNLALLDRSGFRLERVLKPNASFDDYPFPAYDLVDLESYFALNPYRVLDIEQNRGCVLRCAFCYAAHHWGQGEQARSIDRVIADVQRHYDLGARHLSFVGDNFLNSKAYAKGVADGIAGANPGVTWRCYATLPQLTEDVVEAFGRAGCRYVFVGIDAVSDRTRKGLKKGYFRGWPSLRRSLERCLDHMITPTCAFLVHPGASDEVAADNEEAMGIATHVQQLRCGVRLNPLTVYTGTGLAPTSTAHPVMPSGEKPRVLFDGHWMTEQNPYAQERPWLFPYHGTLGPPERFASWIRAAHVGHTLLDHFPCTLMQAIHAGLPLWSMLEATAALSDYPDGRKHDWKDGEVAAFLGVMRERTLTPHLHDTLAFEEAEFRLRRETAATRYVTVEVEDVQLDMQVLPHAHVTLGRAPTDYDLTDAPRPASAEPRDYVVLPDGPTMRYLRLMNGAARLVREIDAAALDGSTVAASADGVANLLAANVIALPAAFNQSQAAQSEPGR